MEKVSAWRLLGIRILATLGILFSVFLLTGWNRAVWIPLLALGMFFVLRFREWISQRRIVQWIGAHVGLVLCVILFVGILLRVGYAFHSPELLSLAGQNHDYRILWDSANRFAAGEWSVSKSWVTVVFYGILIKCFGPSFVVAFVATMVVKVSSFACVYFISRRWIGRLGALIWVLFLSICLTDIMYSTGIATEHLFVVMVFLAMGCLGLAYGSKRLAGVTGWGTLFGVLVWLAVWSRGEGALLWFVGGGLFVWLAMAKYCTWRKTFVFLIPVFVLMVGGAMLSLEVNMRTSGAKTIFCSDDNLWPRLFGANRTTGGQYSATDKNLIWARYVADHPGVTADGYAFGSPRQLAAKCPPEVVPYVKAEITKRWQDMGMRDILVLWWVKARTVWTGDIAPSHPSKSVQCVSKLLAAFPSALMACAALLFFVWCLTRKSVCVYPLVWFSLVFLIGTVALLCLTEASSRYGYIMYMLLPCYVGAFANIVFGSSRGIR